MFFQLLSWSFPDLPGVSETIRNHQKLQTFSKIWWFLIKRPGCTQTIENDDKAEGRVRDEAKGRVCDARKYRGSSRIHPGVGIRNAHFWLRVWMFGVVLVRFGWSRTLQEGQGRSRTKVEKSWKKSKNDKFQKCERFSTKFRSVNDSRQFSILSELRNLSLRVSISYSIIS